MPSFDPRPRGLPGQRRERATLRAAAALACLGTLGTVIGVACSSPTKLQPAPPQKQDAGATDAFFIDTGVGPPPADADASGICGNEVIPVLFDAPNVYFVFDASGSMAANEGNKTRYDALQDAAVELVRELGPLINVGAAIFPFEPSTDACVPGAEVMAVASGDPYDGDDIDGPTTTKFKQSTNVTPSGGTPVSDTLDLLYPGIVSLPGRTIVVLATDGGPNCNATASCDASTCMPNIEGTCPADIPNCCDPSVQGGGPELCVDEPASVFMLQAYAAAGVKVYVVGIPGSETYGDVLDAMAFAGGAPQLVSPHYYKADVVSDLLAVFGSIAALEVSCTFHLAEPPIDPSQTNVYVDQAVLPYDPANGWSWGSVADDTILLKGKACDDLKQGKFKQVQIVIGCPTVVP